MVLHNDFDYYNVKCTLKINFRHAFVFLYFAKKMKEFQNVILISGSGRNCGYNSCLRYY